MEESNKRLSEAENQIKKQEHQLIEQQIKIEELNRALKVDNSVFISDFTFVVVFVCPITLLLYMENPHPLELDCKKQKNFLVPVVFPFSLPEEECAFLHYFINSNIFSPMYTLLNLVFKMFFGVTWFFNISLYTESSLISSRWICKQSHT